MNQNEFSGINASIFGSIALHGAHFDAATVIYCNSFFIGLSLIPFLWDMKNKGLDRILNGLAQTIFITSNLLLFVVQVLGIFYYKFNHRWTTLPDFPTIWDSIELIYTILLPVCLLVILTALCGFFLHFFHKKTLFPSVKMPFLQRMIWSFATVCTLGILARGTEVHTLSPHSAGLFVPIKYAGLLQNNMQCILYSLYKPVEKIPYKHYFAAEDAAKIYPIHPVYKDSTVFTGKNVVFFIMESMSREFLDSAYQPRPATPFIDSLRGQSWVFSNAFANGLCSTEGFSGILGSIPTLTASEYATTYYSANNIMTIGNVLATKGYHNSFFIGYNDKWYGLSKSSAIYGVPRYFGRTEFNDETQWDGIYGIYDHAFFPFALRKINEQPQPFFSTIFNIHTHYPFNVLPKWAQKKAIPNLEYSAAVSYYDDVIRNFFASAQHEKWFKNTIFVFVADHYSRSQQQQELSPLGIYKIPMFIYAPDNSIAAGEYSKVAQQIDIMPTVLNLLHYSGKVHCFGQNLCKKATKQHYIFNRNNQLFQIADDSLVLQYDHFNEKTIGLYAYKTDKNMKKNLLSTPKYKTQTDTLQQALRARIQVFNNTLIDNSLCK
jgi:arylsulfatase A-like enzyme